MIFLNLIQKFVLENHNLVKIIGNGDVNQLEPINLMLNNIDDKNTYRMNCIKQIFPNTVILKEIKRLKLEEDKIKMKEIKKKYLKDLILKRYVKNMGSKP